MVFGYIKWIFRLCVFPNVKLSTAEIIAFFFLTLYSYYLSWKTLEVFVLRSFIKEFSTELDLLDILLDWAGDVCDLTYCKESSILLVMMTKWKSCRYNVVVYFIHEGAHFHIVRHSCLFLPRYLETVKSSTFPYIYAWHYIHASKNWSAGETKRSKHYYCNSFNNEWCLGGLWYSGILN